MVLVATQVKRRRGTTAENDAFTGAEGEITVDLTNKEVRVHTGDNKVGGYGLARKDFENLTDKAKNIGLWCNNASNIITEIPQDIKLELNNGILTLKAGSKVYVPNGAGMFDEVTVASDITTSGAGSATIDLMIFYNQTTNAIKFDGVLNCYSGGSAPTGQTDMSWYDTTNNIIKYTNNSGSTWSSGLALPIAIVSMTNGVLTSIKQVFNGFGYIGSTVFALPGLEYLCSNNRNSDGTLKNTKNKLTTCSVRTEPNTSFSGKMVIGIISDGTIVYDSLERWFVQEQEPPRTTYNIWENPATNEIYQYLNGVWNERTSCVLGITAETAGKINSFSRKQVFRALDYNDTEYIAHQAMPSGNSIDLTLGASGSTYTAPADGYFYMRKTGTALNQYIHIAGGGISQDVFNPLSGTGTRSIWLPAKKGTVITISYNADGPVKDFRFVYAEGVS